MDIRQTPFTTPGQRQVSLAGSGDEPHQVGLTAQERLQAANAPELGGPSGESLHQQRVARWVENSAASARRLEMPAQLRTSPNAEVTTESFKAKAEAEKEWSEKISQALGENRSPALRLIQHDLEQSLNELQMRAGEAPAQNSADAAAVKYSTSAEPATDSTDTSPTQDSADTAPVLPEKQQIENSINQLKKFNADLLSGDDDILSSWDINKLLQESIKEIGGSYVSSYNNILTKFNTFFQDFADFKSKISQYISAGEDGKIKVNAPEIQSQLNILINKYSNYTLYPADGKTATQAEAKAWAKEMGLTDNCVISSDKGGYSVIMDIHPLTMMDESIRNTFKSAFGNVSIREIDSAQYQAFLAGFDMQSDKYQNFMQVMSQKYTTANSVNDNLIKVLSSTITSLLESDKSFFNI